MRTPAKPRARDLGVPFDGTPGKFNAITDVAGVAVGHKTLIEGTNVRTGVTSIIPRATGSVMSDPLLIMPTSRMPFCFAYRTFSTSLRSTKASP